MDPISRISPPHNGSYSQLYQIAQTFENSLSPMGYQERDENPNLVVRRLTN